MAIDRDKIGKAPGVAQQPKKPKKPATPPPQPRAPAPPPAPPPFPPGGPSKAIVIRGNIKPAGNVNLVINALKEPTPTLRPGITTGISSQINTILGKTASVSSLPSGPLIPIKLYVYSDTSFKTTSQRASKVLSGDDFTVVSKSYEPFEKLTGISNERPEILLLSSFVPLSEKISGDFNNLNTIDMNNNGINVKLTSAGDYADTQMQLRKLITDNMDNLLVNVSNFDPEFKGDISNKIAQFKRSIETLKNYSGFLQSLITLEDETKNVLNFRHPSQLFDINVVKNAYGLTAAFPTIYQYPDKQTSVLSLLYKNFGYSENNSKFFASTKIWLQALYEFRQNIKFHSLQLIDDDTTIQKNDIDFTKINRDKSSRFTISTLVPGEPGRFISEGNVGAYIGGSADHPLQLPTIASLSIIGGPNIADAIKIIEDAYSAIYYETKIKNNDDKILLSLSFLSKEYRYSSGLIKNNVVDILQNYYKYKITTGVQTNNSDIFNFVIGRFSDDIFHIPQPDTTSLANIAYHSPEEKSLVLTYEQKYIDNTDESVLTPGYAYFVEPVLRSSSTTIDTTMIKQLKDKFAEAASKFYLVAVGMNLLSAQYTIIDAPKELLYSEEYFYSLLTSKLLNVEGKLDSAIDGDTITALFGLAATNKRIKSLLFLYTISKFDTTLASGYRASVTDDMITEIINTLDKSFSTVSSSTLTKFETSSTRWRLLSKDQIRKGLKDPKTVKIINIIDSFLKEIIQDFTKIADTDRTRYSGHLNTTMAIVAFDIIVNIIQQYTQKTLIGIVDLTSVKHYVVTEPLRDPSAKSNLSKRTYILGKFRSEISRNQKAFFTILGSLHNVRRAAENYINTIESKDNKNKFDKIVAYANSDNATHMNLLLNKQQISLISSAIDDISERLVQTSVEATNKRLILDLDDTLYNSNARKNFRNFFKLPQFTSAASHNIKIMSVGIPLGFTRKLKQRIKVDKLDRTSFDTKENDIIDIVIHRVDLQNSGIVYKPIKFKFELSRLPTKVEELQFTTNKTSLLDIAKMIPTRDYDAGIGTNSITYFSKNIQSPESARQNQIKEAFSSTSYSFLQPKEKEDLYINHVSSYFLSQYIKLMTGLSVDDTHFSVSDDFSPLINSDFTQVLLSRALQKINEPLNNTSKENSASASKLFPTISPNNTQPPTPQSAKSSATQAFFSQTENSDSVPERFTNDRRSNQNTTDPIIALSKVTSEKNNDAINQVVNTTVNTTNTITHLADDFQISSRLFKPKYFDRIYNVIFDPDDFEIDYNKTISTQLGATTFTKMITDNSILVIKKGTPGETPAKAINLSNFEKFIVRSRDKNGGDLIMDKYFVSIESFDKEGV